MLSEGTIVHGIRNHSYKLSGEIGTGGEGTVFLLDGGKLVAKIYKSPASFLEKKITYMVQNPIAGNSLIRLGWPKDVIYDGNNRFLGYTMDYLPDGIEIFEIARKCTSSEKAKKMFPNYTWKLNLLVAHNLAASVHYLHGKGIVIGDMNCKNILVMRDASIAILDTDSFDFKDKKTGTHYKCTVGTEDYLAPELQGRNLTFTNSRFDIYTDYFALAIHIFQLLMDNYHPFSGRKLTRIKDSVSNNPRQDQICKGICPFIKRCQNREIPAGAPTIETMLPDYIRRDFIGTFDYDMENALERACKRTSAQIWMQDLNRLLRSCAATGSLIQCRKDPSHYYLRSVGICGLCLAQKKFDEAQNPG